MSNFGQQAGDICWRNGCQGVIAEHKQDGCSCHISPPCFQCTEPKEFCPLCDWSAKDDDDEINGFMVKYADRSTGLIVSWEPRPLDPRKIDYRIKPHSNSSQECEGVYPEGTTRDEVERLVAGTFGGRFEQFGGGTFRYIAYTD